jgi:hypothetical protein
MVSDINYYLTTCTSNASHRPPRRINYDSFLKHTTFPLGNNAKMMADTSGWVKYYRIIANEQSNGNFPFFQECENVWIRYYG